MNLRRTDAKPPIIIKQDGYRKKEFNQINKILIHGYKKRALNQSRQIVSNS